MRNVNENAKRVHFRVLSEKELEIIGGGEKQIRKVLWDECPGYELYAISSDVYEEKSYSRLFLVGTPYETIRTKLLEVKKTEDQRKLSLTDVS